MTIPREMKSTMTYCDSTLCSVFRPARCVDTFLQKPHLLWDFAERHDLFRALRGGSHRPPCTPAPTAGRVYRFPQSSCLSVSHAADPFCGIHGLRIVTSRLSSNRRQ